MLDRKLTNEEIQYALSLVPNINTKQALIDGQLLANDKDDSFYEGALAALYRVGFMAAVNPELQALVIHALLLKVNENRIKNN